MNSHDKILSYAMTGNDKLLAEIAQLIIDTYNASYQPSIIPSGNPRYVKHTPEGYSFIATDPKDTILTTTATINDFVEHVLRDLTGDTSAKWKEIYISDAVKNALNNHFAMKVDLSNIGPHHRFDAMGIPELPIHPTIWAKRTIDENAFKEMEEKGFCYFARDMWEIEL